jgi:hypothetical protein
MPMAPHEKMYHVRFQTAEVESLHQLPLEEIDMGCMGGFREQPDGTYALEAVVPERILELVKDRPVTVEILADLDQEVAQAKRTKDRQVGQGNRFTGENWIPRGLGKKMHERGPS